MFANIFRWKNRSDSPEKLLSDYRSWLRSRGYSDKTVSIYQDKASSFLAAFPNPLRVKDIDIENYFKNLLDKNLSRSFFLIHYNAVRNFFNYLRYFKKSHLEIDKGLISFLRPLRQEKRVVKLISDQDLSTLLKAPDLKSLRGCRDYVMMLFLLHGLRAQEICNIKLNDVFTNGHGPGRHLVINVRGKGRKERQIILERSGDTEWALLRYSSKRDSVAWPFLFPAMLGKGRIKQLTTNGLYKILYRYAKPLKITTWRPHVWRHTAAVKMLESGVPLLEVQARLGHESISTTEKYLKAATINQDQSSKSDWIHKLRKADNRFRRWRVS
jgi:integrase/recombinase XerD